MNFFRSTVFFINFIDYNAWFQTKVKCFCNTKRVSSVLQKHLQRQTPSAIFNNALPHHRNRRDQGINNVDFVPLYTTETFF
jgi:hypothetical protein